MARKSKKNAGAKKVRVQFDFSEKSLDKLDELADAVNASTRAEIIRQALALYTRCFEAEKSGSRLCLRDKQGNIKEIWLLW